MQIEVSIFIRLQEKGNIKEMSEMLRVLTSFDRRMWLHQNISSGNWDIFLGDMMNSKNVLIQVFLPWGKSKPR